MFDLYKIYKFFLYIKSLNNNYLLHISGKMILEDVDFPSTLKYNKLTLNEDVQIKISNHFQHKICLKNVISFLQLAKVFNLTGLSKTVLRYIESCFTMVVESNKFLELDYNIVVKVLLSSELNIDTEIEVFQAAEKWLSYNIKERGKFAKSLLLKVRLPLLSDHSLNYIINKPSSFSRNPDCVTILKDVLNNKVNVVRNSSSFLFTHRYCCHKNPNILICGGFVNRSLKTVTTVTQIDGNNLKNVKSYTSMNKERRFAKSIVFKGDIYVFYGRDMNYKRIFTIEKYSPLDDCWSNVTDMYDDRNGYCMCSFMDKIYIMGGYVYGGADYSLQFDPNCTGINKWKEVAGMNQARYQVREHAACAVFEGKIVVSGGSDNPYNFLNTVESYDVIGNEWSPMPNMINTAVFHSMFVVKNKLFVFGTTKHRCEVYDNASKVFTALKSNILIDYYQFNTAVKVGSRIYVFLKNTTRVVCYDVTRDLWSEDSCKVTENLEDYSVVSIPSC